MPTYTDEIKQNTIGQEATSFKAVVNAASTANVTITTGLVPGQAIDGVTLTAGMRVLLKDQTTASQNGIYVVNKTPYRAKDFDAGSEIIGAFIPIIAGTTNAFTLYQCTNTSVTVGTTNLTFAKRSFAT